MSVEIARVSSNSDQQAFLHSRIFIMFESKLRITGKTGAFANPCYQAEACKFTDDIIFEIQRSTVNKPTNTFSKCCLELG